LELVSFCKCLTLAWEQTRPSPLKTRLDVILMAGPASVVLDLSKVVFIDSSGLGAILSVLKRMPKGCELIICGTTDPVTSMFKLTRLDRIFTMRKTVDDAVSTLSV
jgi:anti-sigma B factor antagonist